MRRSAPIDVRSPGCIVTGEKFVIVISNPGRVFIARAFLEILRTAPAGKTMINYSAGYF
jgi:hypothetical protein